MTTFHLERRIPAPPSAVFEVLSDFRDAGRWQSSIQEVEVLPDGPIREGSVVIERRQLAGQAIDLSYKVTELVPDERIRVEGTDGPVQYRAQQVLSPADRATDLSVTIDIALHGPMRFAARLIAPSIRREAEADLDRLARLLVGRTAP
jgi:uncharacterized protein YndB with AHSA1/START domain